MKQELKFKPKADIEYEIRKEMAKHPECQGEPFNGVDWNGPEDNGCNWHLILHPLPSGSTKVCRLKIQGKIDELQSKYFITDPLEYD